MGYTQKITWEPLRSIDSATFTGSFQELGTPLAHPAYKIKLINNSTVLVTVSIDGTTAVDVVPATSFFLYDETVLASPSLQFLPQGTQIFVNGSAGEGLVYLVVQYIETN